MAEDGRGMKKCFFEDFALPGISKPKTASKTLYTIYFNLKVHFFVAFCMKEKNCTEMMAFYKYLNGLFDNQV